MRFSPRHCPHPACPSSSSGHFRWRHKGFFRRRCDGRQVQRFLCLECRRTFSTQSFRLDHRLHKPHLHLDLFGPLVSKVTHRQAARILGCSRSTIAHRLLLLGRHCRDFHLRLVNQAAGRGGLSGTFQLDELETFEHSRRLAPLTVPVLIERQSYFILDASVATLPARGGLSPAYRARKQERERLFGRRTSGSREAVKRSFERLHACHASHGPVLVQTDFKTSYASSLRRLFGSRLVHQRCSSRARRDHHNPLFPINLTLAMLRDGVSRLVRRSWAASKLKERLERHLWIWIAWRNYVRAITNRAPQVTAGIALGLTNKMWTVAEMCAWKVFESY